MSDVNPGIRDRLAISRGRRGEDAFVTTFRDGDQPAP
jgi:hypothetical protein